MARLTVVAAPARILVADDRPEVLQLTEQTLGGRYQCEFATNVEEARVMLLESSFELVLCDIEMAGVSGLVLVEEITREFPQTAVVMITGIDDPDVAEQAFRLGAHGYLVKPLQPGQLLITTMNALRHRELEMLEKAHSSTLEDRLRMLMDRAPVPMYVKDRDYRYVIANQVAHEVAGLGPDELIGLTDAAIMPAASERVARESDRLVLDGGEGFETEQTLLVGSEERTFLTVKYPFVDDTGEIVGISGVSADITAKHQAERLREELAGAQAEAITAQAKAIEELRSSRQETVEHLARAIESHDSETGAHVDRMAAIASYLAIQIGLDRDQVVLLHAAAPMHDVGKIATPDEILRKPGPLTAAERTEMQRHTTAGHEILVDSDSGLLQMAARIALTHHERYDGSGYPQGLAGEEIPIEGRIVAVADVFDALLSDRCYRAPMSVHEAVAIIEAGKGTHFDPEVAQLLLDHLEEALSLRS
ncbi:MAG TPA: HD domain-containing phosphohydrolase [Solirubrobacterales bacterium]|nr:HD domain-containing phosphohydrolase [Solirubrobacterales bacterium]